MFSHLFRAAQSTVDNALGQVLNGIIVAIPFLVAAGFGTAALFMRLSREHGPEMASLMMTGMFGFTGLVCLTVLLTKGRKQQAPEPIKSLLDEQAADPLPETVKADLSSTDKELLTAAASTVVPMALPALLRLITRNFPLFIALAAALLAIMNRDSSSAEPAEAASEPTPT